MPATTRPLVPIVMGSGRDDAEERRAFFQSRLLLLGRWSVLVSGGFFVTLRLVRLIFGVPFESALWFHALATGLAGLMWVIPRRWRLSLLAMNVVDAGTVWLVCVSFTLMTLGLARSTHAAGVDPGAMLYIGLLASTFALMARAVSLPSTTGRTVFVGTVAMIPTTVLDAVALPWAGPTREALVMSHAEMVAWQVGAVAMTAITSRVIYGLRQEVNESRRLGQYTLEEKIGEGGMGIVYRARHAMLRRPTAVKLLPPQKAGDENILRFEREVQLTAGLSHPNTVAIFDYGRTADGIFYYAMEYLDGINLEQLVKLEGPVPAPRVVHIVRQVCGSLAEAHDVGLVHRDVKPANIILCERGGMADVAKVVDFGLVKRFHADPSDATTAVTLQSTIVGTPLYIAPECFSGDGQVDARSDLYALGAVAYLLLTGGPVFTARSVVEICAHHLHTPPVPPSVRLGSCVPPDVERIVLQCLAKAPADRPQSARALLEALDGAAVDVWTSAEAATWWARYRRTHPPVFSSGPERQRPAEVTPPGRHGGAVPRGSA